MDSVAPVKVMTEKGAERLKFFQQIQHVLNMFRDDYDANNHVDYFPFSINGELNDVSLNTDAQKLIMIFHKIC
jgi:hypothetical protein